ncbi:MAG TPA: hypothetical protein VFE62_08120, partial [Gemmataceae bacterium]|nr:hypothetical protein [Gemmataceae bacterium]
QAELPKSTIHVLTGPRSELAVRAGDLIQLEHTFSLLESAPKDAFAITSQPKHVAFVRTFRIANPKLIGPERATIAALFKAEGRGRSIINLEIIEKNGKRLVQTCQVDVR